jgi:hypothetical protein
MRVKHARARPIAAPTSRSRANPLPSGGTSRHRSSLPARGRRCPPYSAGASPPPASRPPPPAPARLEAGFAQQPPDERRLAIHDAVPLLDQEPDERQAPGVRVETERPRSAFQPENQFALLSVVEPRLPSTPWYGPQRLNAVPLDRHGPAMHGLPAHADAPPRLGLAHTLAEQSRRLAPPSFERRRIPRAGLPRVPVGQVAIFIWR